MRDLGADEIEMLVQARERSKKLLDDLEKHQSELKQKPPALDPKSLEEGMRAMENAVASARRALEAIDDAMRIALPKSD